MKVKKLYYSDLFVEENVGDVEQRKDLLSLILKMRDKSLDTKDVKLNSNLSNTNCYRFGFSMINEEFNLKWLLDEIKKLIEKAVRGVIIIIVLVFDPLAIILLIAANREVRLYYGITPVNRRGRPKGTKISNI